jgi:hypothetical protein
LRIGLLIDAVFVADEGLSKPHPLEEGYCLGVAYRHRLSSLVA